MVNETTIKKDMSIKGTRDGLLIDLGIGAWHNVLAGLEHRIASTPDFFRGARVILNVGPRRLLDVDARAARDMLARYDVILHGLISEDEETQHMAELMGLHAELPKREPARPAEPEVESDLSTRPAIPAALPVSDLARARPPDDPDAGLITRRTLRSGQQLRHPGSITVIGDVNPGAEIVAGGDIVVWGKLRGTAHAGAMGDANAVVCALDMQPTQLRIASHITRSPDERRRKPLPEVARVRNNQIVVESWEVK